jgi:AraC-like DNA-binding protein
MSSGSDEARVRACLRHALACARDALAGDPAAAPRLADLARAAGVSPRTLQRHFARDLKSTPRAVILRWRLDLARETLAANAVPSVLAATLHHGFEHPGRFAIAYRKAFGESPSTTLRRARATPAPSLPPDVTLIRLRTLTSSDPRDAGRLRRLTDDLSIALTHAREVAPAESVPGLPPDARVLILDGHVDGDSIVLSLRQPARARIIWMERLPLATRGVLGWADRAIGALGAAIATERIEQARRTPLHRADPEVLYLRARPAAMSLERELVGVALDLLGETIHRDPTHARAHSLTGWCLAQGANHNFSSRDPDAERLRALEYGRRALALAPDDPQVLTIVAGVMSLSRQLDEAERLVDRSLALDANQPEAWCRRGFLRNFRGDGAGAAKAFRIALTTWPSGGDANLALIGFGMASFILKDYARSARALSRALEQQPSRAWAYRFLTAAAMHTGAQQTAQRSLLSLQRAFPDLTLDWCARSGVLHRGALTRVLDGLAKAGLPQ